MNNIYNGFEAIKTDLCKVGVDVKTQKSLDPLLQFFLFKDVHSQTQKVARGVFFGSIIVLSGIVLGSQRAYRVNLIAVLAILILGTDTGSGLAQVAGCGALALASLVLAGDSRPISAAFCGLAAMGVARGLLSNK